MRLCKTDPKCIIMNYKNKKLFAKTLINYNHRMTINPSSIQLLPSSSLKPIDEYHENSDSNNMTGELCCAKCLKIISHSFNIIKAVLMR